MAQIDKLIERFLRGDADANFRFDDLCSILRNLGFAERVRGSHHIFSREGVSEIVNIQPLRDGRAKTYQVRQARGILWRHGLFPGGVDEV